MANPNKTINNWFQTTLSQAITNTGAGNIFINQLPTDDEGWLVVDASNATKREIFRFIQTSTSRAGGYVIVEKDEDRGLGGTTAQTHLANAEVKMNNTANHYSYIDIFIRRLKQGFVEKAANTGLAIKIYPINCLVDGVRVNYTGTTHWDGADSKSVVDAATNYVEIDSAGAIQINQTAFTANRKRLAIVVAAGGNITSVQDVREYGSEIALATIQALLAAHTTLTNNPHDTTFAQVLDEDNEASQDINMADLYTLINLPDPSSDQDAANKRWVESLFPPSGGVATLGIFGSPDVLSAAVKFRALSARLTIARNAGNNSFDFDAVQQTQEDFTTVLKNKLDGIEAGANLYVLPSATEGTRGGVFKASDAEFNTGTDNTKYITTLQVKTLLGTADLKTNFVAAEALSTDDPVGINVDTKIRKAIKLFQGTDTSIGSASGAGEQGDIQWMSNNQFVVAYKDTTWKVRAGQVADDGTITWGTAVNITSPHATVNQNHMDIEKVSSTVFLIAYRHSTANTFRVAHWTLNTGTLALTENSTADKGLTLGGYFFMLRMNSVTEGVVTGVNSTNDLLAYKVTITGTTVAIGASALTVDAGDVNFTSAKIHPVNASEFLIAWVENVADVIKVALMDNSGATPTLAGTQSFGNPYDEQIDLLVNTTDKTFLIFHAASFRAGVYNDSANTITLAAASVALTNMGTMPLSQTLDVSDHRYHLMGDILINIFQESSLIKMGMAKLNLSTTPDSVTVGQTFAAISTGIACNTSSTLNTSFIANSLRFVTLHQKTTGSFEEQVIMGEYIANALGLIVAGGAAGATLQVREFGKQPYSNAVPGVQYWVNNGAFVNSAPSFGDRAYIGIGSYQNIFVGK